MPNIFENLGEPPTAEDRMRRSRMRNNRLFADKLPVVKEETRSFNIPREAHGETWETKGDFGTQKSFVDYLRKVHEIPRAALEFYAYDIDSGIGEVQFVWWTVDLHIHKDEAPGLPVY